MEFYKKLLFKENRPQMYKEIQINKLYLSFIMNETNNDKKF